MGPGAAALASHNAFRGRVLRVLYHNPAPRGEFVRSESIENSSSGFEIYLTCLYTTESCYPAQPVQTDIRHIDSGAEARQ